MNLETIRQVFSLKNELLIHQGVVFGHQGSFNNLTQLTANGYWGATNAPTYLASYQAALELSQIGFKENRLAAKPNWMFAEDETNQAKLTLYVDPDLLGLHRHLYLDPETVLDAAQHNQLHTFKPESFITMNGIPAQAIAVIKAELVAGIGKNGKPEINDGETIVINSEDL